MNVAFISDGVIYCWIVYGTIELSLVVGWFEVKLLRDMRLLWLMLCKEGAWVVIYRNRVDCEAMCSLLDKFFQVKLWSVMNVLCVTPLPLENVKWFYVIDFLNLHIFKKGH